MKKVLYEELLPEECVQRIKEMPVAYLPLGTLEWHGPHMPLGADGIQSKELFVRVAEKVGGVVLPMLFMGPDRLFDDRGTVFYGMDINTEGALNTYCAQQMKGSAYWMEKGLFQDLLRSIFAQLSRAGVRIVVGHGHGPSTNAFQEMKGIIFTAFLFFFLHSVNFYCIIGAITAGIFGLTAIKIRIRSTTVIIVIDHFT